MAALDDNFWENLLLYVEARKVIPIIGPEFITVPHGSAVIPLHRWIATRLVSSLKLPVAELRDDYGLNEVVSLHARSHLLREELYPRIYSLLKTAPLEPSPSLQALAGINGLRLFVSLTFDGLLRKALEATGHFAPGQISYCPSYVQDLPGPVESLSGPIVFHLLGKCAPSPEYAICDEDVIEFLHAIQTDQRRPKLLFDGLRGNHLLLLGCSFDDWLTRFFLRVVRGVPFSENRRHREFVVDTTAAGDPALVMFLTSYSSNTQVVEGMTPEAFVDELATRWKATRPDEPAPDNTSRDLAAATSPQQGAVFLSYASEDRAVAQELANGLRKVARVDVWFDKDRLQSGDRWERQIRRGLETSSLFIPLLSRATLSDYNRRSWFWEEWNSASSLSRRMSPEEVFIVPVIADDLRPDFSALPERFEEGQAARLPGGRVSPEFAARIQNLVKEFHRRRKDTTS